MLKSMLPARYRSRRLAAPMCAVDGFAVDVPHAVVPCIRVRLGVQHQALMGAANHILRSRQHRFQHHLQKRGLQADSVLGRQLGQQPGQRIFFKMQLRSLVVVVREVRGWGRPTLPLLGIRTPPGSLQPISDGYFSDMILEPIESTHGGSQASTPVPALQLRSVTSQHATGGTTRSVDEIYRCPRPNIFNTPP